MPNSDSDGWEYSKELLSEIIGNGSGFDITFAVTDKPIEDNYYLHRLSEKTCVLSFYEISGILSAENIPPEVFLMRNVYEMVAIYTEFGNKLSSDAYTVHHEDTRGCLYDFNAIKTDVVVSTKKVGLCMECRARFLSKQLPMGFVEGFGKELKRIGKPLIYRVLDFVKEHPIVSLVISLVVSVVLNVFSNYLYDCLK
jgi:hypothetical protein